MATSWLYWTEALSLLTWSLILALTMALILMGGFQPRQSQAPPTMPPEKPNKPYILRIQEIPPNVTYSELLNKLENLHSHSNDEATGDTNVLQLSLVRKDRLGSCATVTFRSLPSPFATIERKSRIIHEYAYDIKFLGITPLYEGHGRRDLIVDVVAVHGLGAHPLGTWKTSGDIEVWLRDFLPKDVPNTRVLLYGYDTKVDKSDSKQSIVDLAKMLLELLKAFRNNTSTSRRPIIFIGQSLGGLLIKKALSLAMQGQNDPDNFNIYKSCYALLFFGVPNLGLRNDQLRSMVKGQPNERLINDLVVDKDSEPSPFLSGLSRRFADCCKNQGYKVISFYERRESPTLMQSSNGTWTRSGPRQLMVTEESATRTGLPDTFDQHIPLNADHSGLVKFEGSSHDGYEVVMQKIKKYAAEAPEAVSERIIPRLSSRQEQCLKYLASFPVSDVRDRINEAENGTLQWISSEPKIDRWWNSEHSSLLWINGSPGQGKSVLCKHILEKLERGVGEKRKASSQKIIYFFCSGQLHPQFQNAETILRTLIVQLLSAPHMFAHLPGQYLKRAERFETAPLARLWAIFRDMISDEYHDRIYCLLDALDEFESGIIDLLERIQRLFSSIPTAKRPSIKFLVTSRQEKNITRSLANAEALSLKARCDDIQRFIHAKLESLSSPLNRLKPLIRQGLVANTGSTFLWVSIVIKRIERLELPNKKKVMREIEDSPSELDELYQKLSRELSRDEDTIRLLIWAIYAREPLSLRELETALALRPEENCRRIQDTEEYRTHLTERAVHDHAGLLLEVVNGKVYLMHQSVKDFFTKADSPLAASDFLHKEKPDSVLARACIRYLDFKDFESAQLLNRIRREYDERSEAMSQYPLLEYASRHWYSHVLSDEDASLLYSDFNGIICPENIRAQLWFTIASGRRTQYTTRSSIAIELDIGWLARLVLSDGEGAPEEHFPVHCLTMLAANRGQVLEALLDRGEPYISGITEEVMKVAAENSNGKGVMMLLLDRQGDKVQITERVIKAAALNSDESIMTLLLDRRGCDIQVTDEVVQAAAWNNNGEVMAILLDRRGDDVQITEEVVKAAAGNWNGKRVMEVLLDRRGDDIQITEEVVEAAAQNYNGEVMAVLLNRRGDSIPMSKELTALIAWRFNAEVMALLLDRRGSDVEITEEVVKMAMGNRNGGEVMTLLLDRRGNDIQITEEIAKRAAKYHDSETITLLLNRRGDEIPITEELTKLIAGRSDVETMALLLDQRGDGVQITEGVVEAAAGNPNGEDVMTLLRDRRGADILVTEGVVRAAAGNPNGRAFMAWLLDQRGDDVQVTEEVLREAAQNSNEEIMTLLLDRRGDNIEISEEVVKAAAKNWGGKNVMAVLLDRRDDVQVTEGVVEAAAQNYSGEVMTLLLDQRGDDVQITEELTALIARKFSVEAMTLLLDRRGSDVHITEEIVKAATKNHNGQEIIALLLDRRGDDVQITEEVMKTVAESWNGQKVMALLLERRRDDIKITEGVVKTAALNPHGAVIKLLLNRLGSDIHITEEVMKAAAGNFNENILMTLLNRDDIQITEEVVKVAARNRNGKVMMLLLNRRGDDIQITEEVVKAAVAGNQDDKVTTLLLNRRDDVRTTDELIKAAAAVG